MYTDMIDLKALRAAAEAATPIYTDLLGDRYFSGDYSTATLTKGQDDFVSVITPTTVLALLDRLEAAEKDAARYRFIRKPAMSQREVILVANAILCFSEEELDDHIDALMKDEQK